MAHCGDSRGIRKFFLKYWITEHHNHLVLEQWTNRLMTASSSKLQIEEIEVLCSRNK